MNTITPDELRQAEAAQREARAVRAPWQERDFWRRWRVSPAEALRLPLDILAERIALTPREEGV